MITITRKSVEEIARNYFASRSTSEVIDSRATLRPTRKDMNSLPVSILPLEGTFTKTEEYDIWNRRRNVFKIHRYTDRIPDSFILAPGEKRHKARVPNGGPQSWDMREYWKMNIHRRGKALGFFPLAVMQGYFLAKFPEATLATYSATNLLNLGYEMYNLHKKQK